MGAEEFSSEHRAQILRNQLFGRISVVQAMMLEAVKTAQRHFPSVIYYREEAAQLIKIGDKGNFFYIDELFFLNDTELLRLLHYQIRQTIAQSKRLDDYTSGKNQEKFSKIFRLRNF